MKDICDRRFTSVTMTGSYHRHFFAMLEERYIASMELIFGTLAVKVLTIRLIDEEMSIIDNSDPGLALSDGTNSECKKV